MIGFLRRKPGPPIDARAFDLLCLTIGVVIALHAAYLPAWLTASLVVVLGVRWWQRRRKPGNAPVYLKLPLVGLLAVAVIFYYGNIFGREPGSALAVGLLVLKLLETDSARDARVCVAFACFTLMAALLAGQGMVATTGVALGLLPAMAALRALQPGRMASSFLGDLRPGLGLLAAAIPLALVAFVLVPRLDSPIWGAPPGAQARTGLSDRLAPGDMVDLLTDDHPAMRVAFDGPLPDPAQRYFRAYVMGHFDGRGWAQLTTGRTASPLEVSKSIRYRVSLEANNQRVWPALDVPMEAPAGTRMASDHALVADRPVTDALSYAMQSALQYRLQPDLDDLTRRQTLQLPAGFNPRTLALGAQWRAQYGNDDAAIARAAMTLFHDGGFSYTLAPAPLGRHSVDDFLFNTHEGFCEHYASAFTVLMRSAGVPARVVTGYLGGYWNKLGEYLLVRQSDAHAWAEVWLTGKGWVRFDPTGAVRPERISLGAAAASAAGGQDGGGIGWLNAMLDRFDVVNRWWSEGVIGFDALRQRGMLTPFGIRDADTTLLGTLLAISCVLFAGIGLAWAMWQRGAGDPLRNAMQSLEHKLAGVGIERRPSEGPQHYLLRAARALPHQRDALERLMKDYLDLRYAHDSPPAESVRRLCRAVRDFRPRRVVK
ncbi:MULTISPECIES: transglutaminase TgpA family protein [Dyella]|uniref:DUF3488 domain-containing protein n=2 Tax=Dyella TaxID=231454 RepID=A0A4R0YUX1_9GAMM|nr:MULTISPECIES: DUF3488 and transglutaminase-like domain-containing protein [Dyella]TBR39180.1 DUF3488 domain-containing protein [Dyella terrae]TCI13233.1 DUF3488 domain-containing protein [Dyella soli]